MITGGVEMKKLWSTQLDVSSNSGTSYEESACLNDYPFFLFWYAYSLPVIIAFL